MIRHNLVCGNCGTKFVTHTGDMFRKGSFINPTCEPCRTRALANSKWGAQARSVINPR